VAQCPGVAGAKYCANSCVYVDAVLFAGGVHDSGAGVGGAVAHAAIASAHNEDFTTRQREANDSVPERERGGARLVVAA